MPLEAVNGTGAGAADGGRRRLFVALDVPEPERFAPALEMLAAQRVRATPVERLHVTLVFMAAVDTGRVDGVVRTVEDVAREHQPFTLAVTGNAGRFGASVVWAEIAPAPELDDLAGRLGARLRDQGVDIGDRGFHPHVTLGRAGRRRVAARVLTDLPLPAFTWRMRALRVVESTLGRGPATWTTLTRAALGDAEDR